LRAALAVRGTALVVQVRVRGVVVGDGEGLALLLAVGVDERVGQDPVDPGPQVRALSEAGEAAGGAGGRLLDEFLGVLRVPGHPQGGPVQVGKQREDLALEPLTKGGILWRRHRAPRHPRSSFPPTGPPRPRSPRPPPPSRPPFARSWPAFGPPFAPPLAPPLGPPLGQPLGRVSS